VPCIDKLPAQAQPPSLAASRLAAPLGLCALLAVLAGCSNSPPPAPAPVQARPTVPSSTPAPTPDAPSSKPGAAAPEPSPPTTPSAKAPARNPRYVKLGPPATPRNVQELRLQFAKRLVAAHPDSSYTARAPERLLAIPVLEVELNADGSVRRIEVLRKPSTGNEATQLAIAAVQRAAPYGEVARLPKPWKVVETFLFDDDLRFKPRTLD
jgi:hypothetical protein